jgi:protein-disulfide isomerase
MFAGFIAWTKRQRAWAEWAGLAVRLVLAGVWAWAALSKVSDPRRFLQAVRAYDATPEWLSKAIGYGLPILELSLAALLLIGLITRYAAALSAVLFLVFIIGIAQASIRGIKIECGCFGGGGQSNSTAYALDILRDVGLLALAVFLIIWPLSKFSVDKAIISSEMVPGLSAKQAKSEKNLRRYRAALVAAETELKHKQRYIAAGTSVAVLLVSLIAIGVQGGRAKINSTVNTANATLTNGAMVGNQQAPVTVDLYEDFQCPICKQLESTLGPQIAPLVKKTSVKVNYHVMSFLDRASNGNRYSSRSANAGYCAADASTDAFVKFHDLLYGKDAAGAVVQPAEGSNGRTDADLIRYGKEAGITSATFSTCVTSQQHAALVSGVTEAASKRGVTGTPTVYINGTKIEGHNGGALTGDDVIAAITAQLKVTKSTVAPAPTPSASRTSVPPATSSKPASSKPASASPSATK